MFRAIYAILKLPKNIFPIFVFQCFPNMTGNVLWLNLEADHGTLQRVIIDRGFIKLTLTFQFWWFVSLTAKTNPVT